MVTNFEEITKELTPEEIELIPFLINGFKSHTSENPIKAPDIVRQMNEWLVGKKKIRMNEPRLRKCVNYIRTQSLLPLIATSNGYYVSYSREELESQIKSLRQRAQSIINCADGLTKFTEIEFPPKFLTD